MSWCGNRLCQFVIVDSALLRTEAVVGRGCLGEFALWVVTPRIRVNPFCFGLLGWIHPLRSADAVVWRSFHRLEVELVLAWPRHELVAFVLKFVMVLWRHGQLRTVLTHDFFLAVRTRSRRELMPRASHVWTQFFAEGEVGSRSLQIRHSVVHSRARLQLGFFSTAEGLALTSAEREGRLFPVVHVRLVLKIVVSRTWHIFLKILVNFVGFGVHVDFWTFSDGRGDWISAGARYFIVPLGHQARSILRSNAPPGSLVLDLRVVGVVLAGRGLEALLLLKLQVAAHLSSNLPRRFLFLHRARVGAVVAGAWLVFLLLLVWLVLHLHGHREARALRPGESARHVVAWPWHLQAVLRFVLSHLAAEAVLWSSPLNLGRIRGVDPGSRLELAFFSGVKGRAHTRTKPH